MLTSRCRADERGFTLIEVLVVLAILSVAALVAISGFSRQPAGLRMEQRVAALRAEILAARRTAMNSGEMVVWRPADGEDGSDIRYQPALGSAQTLCFHADGSGNGGKMSLGDRQVLAIDWVTGEVRRMNLAG